MFTLVAEAFSNISSALLHLQALIHAAVSHAKMAVLATAVVVDICAFAWAVLMGRIVKMVTLHIALVLCTCCINEKARTRDEFSAA